jgi:hypothetical protein
MLMAQRCVEIARAHTMGENLYKPPGEPDAVEILPVRFGGGQFCAVSRRD